MNNKSIVGNDINPIVLGKSSDDMYRYMCRMGVGLADGVMQSVHSLQETMKFDSESVHFGKYMGESRIEADFPHAVMVNTVLEENGSWLPGLEEVAALDSQRMLPDCLYLGLIVGGNDEGSVYIPRISSWVQEEREGSRSYFPFRSLGVQHGADGVEYFVREGRHVISGDELDRLLDKVRNVATNAGVVFIDQSKSGDCGLPLEVKAKYTSIEWVCGDASYDALAHRVDTAVDETFAPHLNRLSKEIDELEERKSIVAREVYNSFSKKLPYHT